MKWLRRLLAPKEAQAAIGILDELELTFACAAFRVIREQVEPMILARPKEFAEIVRRGTPVRQWVLGAVSNVAGDLVESGRYHIYRGVLDRMGPGEDLLRVYDSTIDEAVRLGFVDANWGEKQKVGLRRNIEAVG